MEKLNSIERGFFKKILRPLAKPIHRKISSAIPKFELTHQHVKNAKLLPSREALLRVLPKNAIVAEIGVDEGEFSKKILEIAAPSKLHLVDAWNSRRYNARKKASVEERFKESIVSGKVALHCGLSTETAQQFPDRYFDWIYLDTTHAYELTIEELIKYSKKVKTTGIIAGHDYIVGNWDGIVRYGVIEAVHEFCVKYGWEIIYLTSEVTIHPSFAIRRILEM